MFDDLSWLVVLVALVIFFVLVLEIYVIVVIAGLLASWFGFTGLLWWVCAIMMFCLINGLIGAVWRM